MECRIGGWGRTAAQENECQRGSTPRWLGKLGRSTDAIPLKGVKASERRGGEKEIPQPWLMVLSEGEAAIS